MYYSTKIQGRGVAILPKFRGQRPGGGGYKYTRRVRPLTNNETLGRVQYIVQYRCRRGRHFFVDAVAQAERAANAFWKAKLFC